MPGPELQDRMAPPAAQLHADQLLRPPRTALAGLEARGLGDRRAPSDRCRTTFQAERRRQQCRRQRSASESDAGKAGLGAQVNASGGTAEGPAPAHAACKYDRVCAVGERRCQPGRDREGAGRGGAPHVKNEEQRSRPGARLSAGSRRRRGRASLARVPMSPAPARRRASTPRMT